ncbi:cellulase family glycosylhydrolase [Fluviicola sp.]|uniref:cellulase family glycosylhydrolase n=1 Tax=Fluviicola sp. TaxID=1917219 RepID=UPI0031D810AF
MRKLLLTYLICFSGIPAFTQANWNNTSFVHRSGRQILDGNNTPIRLEGVNLGGWLLWEGWIWGSGYTQEKTIYNRIKNKVGQASADAFRDSVYHHFITRKDIEAISGECFNLVRLPFNHTILEDDANPYVYKQSGWDLLDSVLDWCEDNDLYVLFDMHSAPGGQSTYFVTDPDSPNMWADPVYQTRTAELWKAIANRYKNRGIVAGYDLLNEPVAPADSTLVQFYELLVDSIRTVDTNHMLFIEGKDASTDFSIFTSLPDPNMVFAFHFYSWFVWNIPDALDEYVALSQNMNVPVMCGEWGENNYAPLSTTLDYFKDPAKQISGETFWTWKKMFSGGNYPCYVGVDTSSLWNKSIKWISNGFNPNPTVAEMQQGMNEFVQNMKFQHCFFNDSMSDLLKACSGTASLPENGEEFFQLIPNPANKQVLIHASFEPGTIRIYNPRGQLIESITISGTSYILDLSGYTNGIYFICPERTAHAQKLVVHH